MVSLTTVPGFSLSSSYSSAVAVRVILAETAVMAADVAVTTTAVAAKVK